MLKMIFIFTAAQAADPEDEDPDEVIVVTASRSARRAKDDPIATDVITREDIERSGAEDVADLLEQAAGVDVQRGVTGASVRLQGMDADHVLVLVDGQRVNGRVGGVIDLSRIPADSIERIEIVKGTGSALYGSDAMGGVIHIVTRGADEGTTADLHARGGTLQTADARVGVAHGADAAKLRLDAGFHHNAPWDLDPADAATSGNGAIQGQGSARAFVDLGTNGDLSVSGSYARQDARGVDVSPAGGVFDRRNLTEEARVSVEPRWVTDAKGQLRFQGGISWFRDQYLLDQQGADVLDDFADTRDTLAQLGAQVQRVAARHDILVGVETIAEQLRSERLDQGRGHRERGAAYLQDAWTLHERVHLLPSARVDVDTTFGVAPTARLAGRVDPHDHLTLRLSGGNGFRAPSFREQLLRFDNAGAGYRIEGNPDLRPERSLQASGGVEWSPGAPQLGVSGWWNEVEDLIAVVTVQDVPGNTLFGYDNVERARIRGLEGAAGTGGHGLDLQLGYMFTDARDRDTGERLEGRASHRGTATFGAQRARTRFTTRAVAVGPRPILQDEVLVDAPAYLQLDLKAEQGLGRDVDLFAGVENVLDAGDPTQLTLPPRVVYAGVDGRLGRAPSTPRGSP